MSKLTLSQILFFNVLDQVGIERPITEHKFHQRRNWRFDYCWPDHMIALEVEGGVWTGGRHTRGSGFKKDMQKYNEAAVLGWRLIRVVPTELHSKETLALLRRILLF